jgi:hypothetical protein
MVSVEAVHLGTGWVGLVVLLLEELDIEGACLEWLDGGLRLFLFVNIVLASMSWGGKI